MTRDDICSYEKPDYRYERQSHEDIGASQRSDRCVAPVGPNRRQCIKARGYGHKKLYCHVHADARFI